MSFDDAADDEKLLEAHERRIVRCRSCRARIIFLPTESGKKCPTDADTVEPSDQTFVWGRHVSHFSTCPNASQHRRTVNT